MANTEKTIFIKIRFVNVLVYWYRPVTEINSIWKWKYFISYFLLLQKTKNFIIRSLNNFDWNMWQACPNSIRIRINFYSILSKIAICHNFLKMFLFNSAYFCNLKSANFLRLQIIAMNTYYAISSQPNRIQKKCWKFNENLGRK